jgi:CRP-like cAMP-binding protein
MDLSAEVTLLSQVPMFREVEPSRLKLLAFGSQRLRFDDGELLFRQGQDADAAYLVVEGDVDVLVSGPDDEMLVARMGPGCVIGEMGVLCDTRRTATVRARGDLVALRIPGEIFRDMLHEFPGMALAVMRDLASRLERTTSQLARRVRG